MKKKTLILAAAILASQANAADLKLGSSMVVSSPLEANGSDLAGLALSAEHVLPVSENTSIAFVGQVTAFPESFKAGGPKGVSAHVCGAFSSPNQPFATQVGLGIDVLSAADAESYTVVAPSLLAESQFQLNDNWSVSTKFITTLPVNKSGEISSTYAKAQFGVVHKVAIEA